LRDSPRHLPESGQESGHLAPQSRAAEKAMAEGFTVLAVGSDLGFLNQGIGRATEWMGRCRHEQV